MQAKKKPQNKQSKPRAVILVWLHKKKGKIKWHIWDHVSRCFGRERLSALVLVTLQGGSTAQGEGLAVSCCDSSSPPWASERNQLDHAQREVFFSTECYLRVPGSLPLSRCWEAAARGGDLCLSRWFFISNVMNKKMDVSRHSIPTSVMTIGSWVKQRHPICFLAQFPLKLSFLPTFQLSFNPSGPGDEPCFLLETFNRVVRVSKIPDCCDFMKVLVEQRRERSTHRSLLWERLNQACKAQPLRNWFSLVLQVTEQLVLSFYHLNNTCSIPNGLLVLIIIQSSTSTVL